MTFPTPALRLFLDTANPDDWQTWLPTRLFYGITTNPTLLERANRTCSVEHLADLAVQGLELGVQEIQLQTWGTQADRLVETGRQLAAIDDRIVIKVPITLVGCQAAARLIDSGVRVTLTGIYARHQALMAAALGADYAAPYLGRITDSGRDGMQDIAVMQQVLNGVGSPTRLLVASIRAVDNITDLAAQGLDTFTLSAAIAEKLFAVKLTNQAASDFEQAAQRMG